MEGRKRRGRLVDYQVMNKLGSGAFGVVHKVKRKSDGHVLVMKRVDLNMLSDAEVAAAVQEATLLSKLEHPYIVQYFDSFVDQDSLYIIMEYAARGNLREHLLRL